MGFWGRGIRTGAACCAATEEGVRVNLYTLARRGAAVPSGVGIKLRLYGRGVKKLVIAADIVQETFLRAWKYFETFDSATNCRAWLFRILRNAWISRWRKNRLEPPL